MLKLSDYIGQSLHITRRSIWKRALELHSDKDRIAELIYPSFFSERAECKINNEIFEFKRPHIFSNDVEIRKTGYQLPIATMHTNFFASKGVVDLPRGIKINMKLSLFSNNTKIFVGENDLMATLIRKISVKEKFEVLLEKRSEIIDEHPWLILLAVYFLRWKRQKTGVLH
jgi:hypothetical protein